MVKIVWSRQIIEDIHAASEYHRPFAAAFAATLIDRIFEKAALLVTHPLLGRIVPEASRADIRELLYKQYRLVYRVVNESEVLMLALHHSALPLSPESLFN